MIPKIIHQTCKNKQDIPVKWRPYQQTVLKFHPSWKYILRDDQDNENFIKQYYPQYYNLYRDLKYPINRVDLIRYLYMHHDGGFYIDMDCEVQKPLDPLCNLPFQTKLIVWGRSTFSKTAPGMQGSQAPKNLKIDPAVIASVPNEKFWISLVEGIARRRYTPTTLEKLISWWSPPQSIIMTTGPLLVGRVFHALNETEKNKIFIAPRSYFYSESENDSSKPEAYIIHYSDTSWASPIERLAEQTRRCVMRHYLLFLFFAVLLVVTVVCIWLCL